jgi:hypothetical protein
MKSPPKRLSAVVTAVGVVAFSCQVLAAGVRPHVLWGSPSRQDVIDTCHFPDVIDKHFFSKEGRLISVTGPIEAEIQPPRGVTFPDQPGELGEIFQVLVEFEDSTTFSFVDESADFRFVAPSPYSNLGDTPTDSQFFDIQGIEAVVAEGPTEGNGVPAASNVYCYINADRDSDLCAPSAEGCAAPSRIRVFWTQGTTGFEGPDALQATCGSINADLFIGQQIMGEAGQQLMGPVNFNGCNETVPRFCQRPGDSGLGEDDVILCDTQIGAMANGSCGGCSGGSCIRCP